MRVIETSWILIEDASSGILATITRNLTRRPGGGQCGAECERCPGASDSGASLPGHSAGGRANPTGRVDPVGRPSSLPPPPPPLSSRGNGTKGTRGRDRALFSRAVAGEGSRCPLDKLGESPPFFSLFSLLFLYRSPRCTRIADSMGFG